MNIERLKAVECLQKASSSWCLRPFFGGSRSLPGQKWEWLSRPPPFLSEKRTALSHMEPEAPKKCWKEVLPKQDNVQEGLICCVQKGLTSGVQEGQIISTLVDIPISPLLNPFFLSKKFKEYFSMINISNWLTKEMYLPLKELLTNTPKACQLAIAKRIGKK